MTHEEERLLRELTGGDSLELSGSSPSVSKALGASLGAIAGNPPFTGEITLNTSVKYYSNAAPGTPVEVLPAALPASQQTKYPVYFFGKNDHAGNFAKAKTNVTSAAWNLARMSILNAGDGNSSVFYPDNANPTVAYASGSVVNNRMNTGDMLFLIPMTAWTAGVAGTSIVAEVLIHCNNIAYGSLLDNLASDTLMLNMIRYTVDPTQTSQLENQVVAIKQLPLGKTTSDSFDPNAFITGGTFNNNISDIPINISVDKYVGIATEANYDVTSFSWTLTFLYIQKQRG